MRHWHDLSEWETEAEELAWHQTPVIDPRVDLLRPQAKKPSRCKSTKLIALDPTFTFHGGDTKIHSKLDSNGPTHFHKSGKPTMLLKYEQVAFSAYFGHFTQHSKHTGLDQILFKPTNMEPCRCVLERGNLLISPLAAEKLLICLTPHRTSSTSPRCSCGGGTSFVPPPAMHREQMENPVYTSGGLVTVQGWQVRGGGFSSTCQKH